MAGMTVMQAMTLAAEHQRFGRYSEAEEICRRVLVHQPHNVNVTCRLAAIAREKGETHLSIDLLRKVIARAPRFVRAHLGLGLSLQKLGQTDDAIAAYRQCLSIDPESYRAYHRLAIILGENRRYGEAVIAYRQALVLRPTSHKTWTDFGHLLRYVDQLDAAAAAARRAIDLKSDSPHAYFLLGTVLAEQRRLDDAMAAFRKAIELKPDFARAYCDLGNVFKSTGQIDDAINACRQAVALNPRNHRLHSVLLFNLQYHPDYDAQAIAQEHRAWNRQHALPLAGSGQTRAKDPAFNRRLRIGYVSPYFESHALGWNVLPFYKHHDHTRFEIFSYSDVSKPDAMTNEFHKLSDWWRNTVGLSDEKVADLIRTDRIDILVDLSQHMSNHRLLMFARKLAPVQVSFAGYPGSTGLTAIDYRLSDPYLDPVGMDESVYSEKTVRLPDSFWCFDPLEWSDVAVAPLPAHRNWFITFGCLNNFHKVNDRVLSLWVKVLHEVENSRLTMLALPGSHRQRAIEFLGHEGIDPARIQFLNRLPRRSYLEAYQQIDIGLDTFPYNGHTTSLDAFWMGVPVVTLVGSTAVARAGWCQLSNLKLTELAAQKPAEFVQIAVDLARDIPRLDQLRSTLRSRMEQSPLMDAVRFTRGIELAYWKMWST